jgi:hypothetical protein
LVRVSESEILITLNITLYITIKFKISIEDKSGEDIFHHQKKCFISLSYEIAPIGSIGGTTKLLKGWGCFAEAPSPPLVYYGTIFRKFLNLARPG